MDTYKVNNYVEYVKSLICRIRKAVINSAKDVRDTFRIGFLQVEALWDYILKFGDQDDQDAFFDVLLGFG